ncbi:amidase [Halorubrum laminariae]|uniref:Amidase n=1 Tax=Halorubrum laminariae TaxID=1433523 RepID=A0ABD6C270_9EURY|nr:amidase family protein [Halorubrum laminariae]
MSAYSPSEICEMSGVEQIAAIKQGLITPVDAVEASLARIDEVDGEINAFATLDEERAIETAREVTETIESGGDPGPLYGVPVAIKDLIMTEGIRTTFGSVIYSDFIPERDSVVVERIRNAGGVILGKTNVSEFGFRAVTDNKIFGETVNPVDTDLTPAGSSGGSAAAVTSNMVPFAIGSDGGGSVRLPASFCGLCGIKASFGRVPIYPEHRDPELAGANGWGSVEHIGPITRTVEDAALLLDVMAGSHPMDRHSIPKVEPSYRAKTDTPSVSDLSVAYSPDLGYAAVNPEIGEQTAAAADLFESELGCDVSRDGPELSDYQDVFEKIVANTTDLIGLRKQLYEFGSQIDSDIVGMLETEWTATDFTEGVKGRQRLNKKFRQFMQQYDVLLTPTAAVPPFPIGESAPTQIAGRSVSESHWQSFTYPFNLTGHPAATIPVGRTRDNKPIGLQIVGSHLDDATVIEAAAAYSDVS